MNSYSSYIPLPSTYKLAELPLDYAMRTFTNKKSSLPVRGLGYCAGFIAVPITAALTPLTIIADIIIALVEMIFLKLKGAKRKEILEHLFKKILISPLHQIIAELFNLTSLLLLPFWPYLKSAQKAFIRRLPKAIGPERMDIFRTPLSDKTKKQLPLPSSQKPVISPDFDSLSLEQQLYYIEMPTEEKAKLSALLNRLIQQGNIAEKGTKKIKEIFKYLMNLPYNAQKHIPKDFEITHQRDATTGITWETDGVNSYLLLKVRIQDDGSFKRIKICLDEASRNIFVHAGIRFNPTRQGSHSNLEKFQETVNNEINIHKILKNDCPYIVKLFHAGESTKNRSLKSNLILEYCDRSDLFDFMSDPANFRDQMQLWKIAEGLLEALVYLEKHNIHHRDIKPENIFLKTENGQIIPKLGDFGIAVLLDEERKKPTFCGTEDFIPPEWVKGFISIEQLKTYQEKMKTLIKKLYNSAKEDPVGYLDELDSEQLEELYTKLCGRLRLEKPEIEVIIEENETKFKALRRPNFPFIQKQIELIATSKSDVYAMGLTLLSMHKKGAFPGAFPHHPPNQRNNNISLEICALTQDKVDASFPNYATNSLENLLRKMTAINPDERILASEALKIFKSLRKTKDNFLQS